MPAMSTTSLAALRFLQTHGLSYRAAIKAGAAGMPKNTLDNLARMGYVAIDTTAGDPRYNITPKGRKKLFDPREVFAQPGNNNKPSPAEARAMLSSEEIERLVLLTVRKSATRVNLAAIGRRASLPENMVRPAIIALVQRAEVISIAGDPPTYRANKTRSTAADPVARARNRRGPSSHPTGYSCPELTRNPGLPPERFAAFDLPSRVGNWLHYPDGHKEPFPTREQQAAEVMEAA